MSAKYAQHPVEAAFHALQSGGPHERIAGPITTGATQTPDQFDEQAGLLTRGLGPLHEGPLAAALRSAAAKARAAERERILAIIEASLPPLTNNGNARVRVALASLRAAIQAGGSDPK